MGFNGMYLVEDSPHFKIYVSTQLDLSTIIEIDPACAEKWPIRGRGYTDDLILLKFCKDSVPPHVAKEKFGFLHIR